MDPIEPLVEAVRSSGLHNLRALVGNTHGAAAKILRARVVPTAHGWATNSWAGQTRPTGYRLQWGRGDDATEYSVTWRQIVDAALPAFTPELVALYDRNRELARRIHQVTPIDWPRGVEDHHRIARIVTSTDAWIRDTIADRIRRPSDQLPIVSETVSGSRDDPTRPAPAPGYHFEPAYYLSWSSPPTGPVVAEVTHQDTPDRWRTLAEWTTRSIGTGRKRMLRAILTDLDRPTAKVWIDHLDTTFAGRLRITDTELTATLDAGITQSLF